MMIKSSQPFKSISTAHGLNNINQTEYKDDAKDESNPDDDVDDSSSYRV